MSEHPTIFPERSNFLSFLTSYLAHSDLVNLGLQLLAVIPEQALCLPSTRTVRGELAMGEDMQTLREQLSPLGQLVSLVRTN